MLGPKVSNHLDRDELLQFFRDNSLFTHDEMETKVLPLLAKENTVDGAKLARALEKAGLITTYQADAICGGTLDDLRIGNYDVLDRLGAGGMGTVFKARHRRMKRIVALKVMSRNLCADEKAVQRFQREVETIARLQHPNIVMAYDADEAEVGHFLVMEFVNGKDLSSIVAQQGPLPLAEALDCILQAARGLEYAHQEGIIHRDIKPANLLLDAQGVVKVTDLGLARLHEQNSGQSSLTQAGGIVGTADYMSPEQAFDSATLDHRTDIYSLGCTLYFLLLGKAPFSGTSIMATLLRHLEGPIPLLPALRPDVPTSVDVLFRRMIAKKSSERFQNMGEVVAALSAVEVPVGTTGAQVGSKGALKGKGSIIIQTRTSTTASLKEDPSSQTMDLRPDSKEAKTQKPTILLVEPSRTQAGIIRKFLDSLGVEVLPPVQTGQEALEICNKNNVTVVMSAMHLKDMSGIQLAHGLTLKPPVPGFVLVSSESELQGAGSLSEFKNTHILHKPFAVEKLVETLNAITGLKLSSSSAGTGTIENKITTVVEPKGRADRARLKVLLVDDSSTARVYAKSMLQKLGFTTFIEAGDGAQAVAILAREPFDLIISDYNMPLMDGQALLSYLRGNPATQAIPVVMVTTETNPAKLEAIRKLGVAGLCEKAFTIETLQGIVDRLFS
jgi:serine/threonine protein kinase